MINLQTQDLKDVIEVSHRALECDSMESLQRETLTLMERSLGARSSVYFQLSRKKKEFLPQEGAEHGVPEGALARWCSEYHSSDPFMKRYLARLSTRPGSVIISSEVINHKEYVSSSFYNDFMKPQSIYHVMIIGLKAEGCEPMGVFGLHRSRHAPAFTKYEVAKANMLAPHLKGAVQRVMARQMLRESRWLADLFADDLANDGVAVLNQCMSPVFISQKAQQMLGGDGDYLPDNFLQQCSNMLASQHCSPHGSINFSFTHKGRPIKVAISPLEDLQQRPHFIVRFDATLKDAPETLLLLDRMKNLGLSRREIDVAQLLGVGLTSILIAEKLCISVRTIDNHLRSIYKKVGVHNRTSLIYRLSNGDKP